MILKLRSVPTLLRPQKKGGFKQNVHSKFQIQMLTPGNTAEMLVSLHFHHLMSNQIVSSLQQKQSECSPSSVFVSVQLCLKLVTITYIYIIVLVSPFYCCYFWARFAKTNEFLITKTSLNDKLLEWLQYYTVGKFHKGEFYCSFYWVCTI